MPRTAPWWRSSRTTTTESTAVPAQAASGLPVSGEQAVSRGEFVPGEPYLFCRDPDGYELEIWYERPTPADPAPE